MKYIISIVYKNGITDNVNIKDDSFNKESFLKQTRHDMQYGNIVNYFNRLIRIQEVNTIIVKEKKWYHIL